SDIPGDSHIKPRGQSNSSFVPAYWLRAFDPLPTWTRGVSCIPYPAPVRYTLAHDGRARDLVSAFLLSRAFRGRVSHATIPCLDHTLDNDAFGRVVFVW